MNNKTNTQKLTMLSMFIALIIVMNSTGLAFIKLPFISITIIDIPVIVGAIALGPTCGAILGGAFGFISMWEATHATAITDMVFSPLISGSPVSSLVMALGARILFAFAAGLVFKMLKAKRVSDYISILISTITGLVIHNISVIGCLCFLFPELNVPLKKIILSIISVSFLTKIVIAFILAGAFAKVYSKAIRPIVKCNA